jgi:hypothetical protein
MKILMTLSLAGALVALPLQTDAWVAAAGGYHGGAYHGGAVAVYHPPCYHAGYSCGGVSTGTAVAAGMAGLAVGAMVGSAVANANTPTVVVAPAPVYVAPYYYAPPPVVVAPSAPVGSIYYSLPYGAQSANINGAQYYVLNGSYYKPFFGNNGVYYQVVPNPI